MPFDFTKELLKEFSAIITYDYQITWTSCSYCYVQQFQKEIGNYQAEVDEANASGQHLISDVLDDPAVTKQDLEALNEAWETTRRLSARQQERIKEALEDAKKFEGGLNDLVVWIDAQRAKLQSQLPPDEDASVLQQQIEEHKVYYNNIM